MSRPRMSVVVVLAAFAACTPVALAHQGNPSYESLITAKTGLPAGVSVSILNREDSLQLTNRSDKDVIVLGYEDEPYVRIAADGTVAVNESSTATYINEERDGKVPVPAGVDPKADPAWKVLDKTGRYSWHDHRIHWMNDGRPPQVKDEDVKTRIFDWKVDLRVAGQPAVIRGVLNWTPTAESGAPVGAIVGLVAFVLLSGAFVVVVRRRRDDDGAAPTDPAAPVEESW